MFNKWTSSIFETSNKDPVKRVFLVLFTLTKKVINTTNWGSKMTLNKYFVFIPAELDQEIHKDNQVISEKETQRQALVKQAQQQGGL